MNKPDNITPQASEDKPGTISRVLTFLAYPLSLIAGFTVAHTSVRESAYEKVKSKGGFLDLTEKFSRQHNHEITSTLNDVFSKTEFNRLADTTKRLHNEAVQSRMEKLGINTFVRKWRYINRIDKQKAIIDGLTITGIVVGAILTVANSKSILHMLLGDSDKDQQR